MCGNPPTLLKLIETELPGIQITASKVSKSLVLGFFHESRHLWLALDHQPSSDSVEDALGCLANMLAFCQGCQEGSYHLCHMEYRTTAGRLRRFLGDDTYQHFVARAPVLRASQPIEVLSAPRSTAS